MSWSMKPGTGAAEGCRDRGRTFNLTPRPKGFDGVLGLKESDAGKLAVLPGLEEKPDLR